ncbi:MAG: putative glycolipid-binding domain-containing protein [Zoogloeaceae bacterium]|nr:putative glycolipid-binding domain-containing protein [Zoogloeaceae bacterium]
MPEPAFRDLCWVSTWSPAHSGAGLEHVRVAPGEADSVLVAIDEDGIPFRMAYRLHWDDHHVLRQADLTAHKGSRSRSLSLRVDGAGRWLGGDGQHLDFLDGCIDIDIWPTPFTNSFPIRRSQLQIGERREFCMAWIAAPDLTIQAKAQAYTRLADRLYLFESLDGSGFTAELAVDEAGFVLDYPCLFTRVTPGSAGHIPGKPGAF